MQKLINGKVREILLVFGMFFAVTIYAVIASRLADVSFFSILPASVSIFVAFFAYFKDCASNGKYQFLCILLLAIDLILIVYNSVNRNLPFTNVDWLGFDGYAKDALSRSDGIFEIFGNSMDFFTACMAIIYKMFGANVTIVYFYILPLSFVLAHYLYKTIFLITNSRKRSILFSVAALLMPVNFIFSLSVLREIPIQCVSVISLYYFINYMIGKNRKGLIRAFLFAALAALMHSGMIAILLVYLYVLAQKKMFKNVKMIRISTFIFAGALVLLMSLPIFSSLIKRFDIGSGLDGITESVNTQNSHLVTLNATTNYVNDVPTDMLGLISSLPYRIIMFVISPLPWQINNISTLIAFFADAIFRYYIVFRVVRIMFSLSKYSAENREIIETVFMAVVLFDLIFCLGTTNYGTAMRHRAKMLPFELVLLSIPMVGDKYKKTEELSRMNKNVIMEKNDE